MIVWCPPDTADPSVGSYYLSPPELSPTNRTLLFAQCLGRALSAASTLDGVCYLQGGLGRREVRGVDDLGLAV